MGCKFLILNTDYPDFLSWLYSSCPGLSDQPYDDQLRVRNQSLFGIADFYSRNLRELGHEAWDIHANNECVQKAWALEHGILMREQLRILRQFRELFQHARHIAAKTALRRLKRVLGHVLRSFVPRPTWFYEVLAAQIKHYRPDVVLNQDMASIGVRFLREMKPHVRLLVGQIASPIPENEDFSCYDLVISSLPNVVEYFDRRGMPTAFHRFGFEPRILKELRNREPRFPVSFVGSLSWHHESRIRLLEHLCARLDVKIWGQGVEGLSPSSPIRQHYLGQAWGIEMYKILHSSLVTLNHHIGMAESYANNMRLFEATGVGTLLITDSKENLSDIFEVGEEVIAYRSQAECGELIQYYLTHDKERERIATAGQKRTLRDHTYLQRMEEFLRIVHKYL